MIDKKKSLVKLLSWASIQALTNIKRKKDEENTILLTWKDNQKQDGNVQVVFVQDSTTFIGSILNRLKEQGYQVTKNIVRQPDLNVDDVGPKALNKIDIQATKVTILQYEQEIATNLNVLSLNALMGEYSKVSTVSSTCLTTLKAIEFYSGKNDAEFKQYLEKLHGLLDRPDVKVILEAEAQSKPPMLDDNEIRSRTS